MSNFTIGIQVDDEFVDAVRPTALETLARQVLEAETVPTPEIELAIVVGGDEQIQDLNRQYRGIDAPTDVLSFATMDDQVSQASAPGMPLYLGDVIISYPRALAQAAEAGHSAEEELSLLVVHGLLHLLGYDHDNEEHKAAMWSRQDAILGKHLVD